MTMMPNPFVNRYAAGALTLMLGLLALDPPATAQAYGGPLGGSPKVFTPRTITEAGGEFQVDEETSILNVFPDAERFEAVAKIQCTGMRGNVRLASFILNGGRRATRFTENGRELPFTHAGDFLTVRLPFPMGRGQRRIFELRYTGKAHSVSSKWIREYKIDKYAISVRVMPLTGNLTAIASLKLVGKEPTAPPRPAPSRFPGTRDVPHWVPPMLKEGRDQPKLGLVLNDTYAIDRVTLSGQDAPYKHSGGIVRVDLAQPFQEGAEVPVQVFYTGKIRNADRNRIWDNFDNLPPPTNPQGAE